MAENLSDSLSKNLDLSAYSPVKQQPMPPTTGVQENLQPVRSQFVRCPLPAIWSASPDALREMYIGGKIPQTRLFNPPQQVTSSGSVSETITVAGSSASGGGSSNNTLLVSSQVVLKTPSLPPGNKFTGSFVMAKSFQLLSAATNAACRIELYGNSSAQAQDLARAIDTPPPAGTLQNLISDLVLDTLPFQWFYQNRVGANADSPQTSTVYLTATNVGAATTVYTLTFQFVGLES